MKIGHRDWLCSISLLPRILVKRLGIIRSGNASTRFILRRGPTGPKASGRQADNGLNSMSNCSLIWTFRRLMARSEEMSSVKKLSKCYDSIIAFYHNTTSSLLERCLSLSFNQLHYINRCDTEI